MADEDKLDSLADDLGLSEDEQEQALNSGTPSLNIPDVPKDKEEGEPVYVKFTHGTKEYDKVEVENDGDVEQVPVVTVELLDGSKRSLWLSATSMKKQYFKLAHSVDDIEGQHAAIYKRQYDHPKYGDSIAYVIDVVDAETAMANA